MDDRTLLEHIDELSNEELALEEAHTGMAFSDRERSRMKEIEIELDQAYDLLRQRRARRSAGLNPDDAAQRKASVVENYEQ